VSDASGSPIARGARPADGGYRRASVLLTDQQCAWAWQVAERRSLKGLNCSVSDVVRLALDELRDRYPSTKTLEAALREHVWRELGTEPRRVRPSGPAAPPPALGRRRPLARPTAAMLARRAPPPGEAVRVLVVDHDATIRRGLRRALAGAEDIALVGELGDAGAALEFVAREAADVVLMDLAAPGQNGIAAVRALAMAHPEVRVVALVPSIDRELLLEAVDAGAVGYVLVDAGPEELAAGLRAAARGRASPALRAALSMLGGRSALPQLTGREREVLALVGRGLANKQIARRLGISEKTVKAHLGRVFQRIGVSDRTQAALWAVKSGLLERTGTS
jgi:DNA-binding NarL/FixJ family response regulator